MYRMGRMIAAVTLCLSLGACAGPELFPPEVMQDVAPTFDYPAWRRAMSGHAEGVNLPWLKVQLGGRIVASESRNGGLLVVVEQLPIVNHPAYGPTDTIKRKGDFEFAFLFKGEIESSALAKGNRLIMVGRTQGKRETVLVDGAPKSEPYLIAQCVHIWKTEGREIADFVSAGVGGGFSPLEEKTYCEKK